jgi:hypothetical protein
MVIKTIFFKMCLTILWSITKIQIHHINIQNYIFIDWFNILSILYDFIDEISKGVAMIFCWGGPDFKPQTDDR